MVQPPAEEAHSRRLRRDRLVDSRCDGLHPPACSGGYGLRREFEAGQPRYLFDSPGELHGLIGEGAVDPL